MTAKIVATVNAELIINADGLLYLPKWVHRHLSVRGRDVGFPEYQGRSQTVGLISAESSDGVTQSFDPIKFDSGYGFPIDHRVDRAGTGAMVYDQSKLVAWFRYGVYGNNIHPREEVGERFGEPLCLDFFLTLLKEEIPNPVVSGGVLWLTMGNGVPVLLLSPRPEPLCESNNYRLDERLVRVVLKQLIEFCNIYVASYFKKFGVCTNGFISN